MRRALPVTFLTLAGVLLAACTSGATVAPSSAAPSVAPTTASTEPSVAASPSVDACAKDSLAVKTPGKLTIGTDNPAYPPYFQIPDGTATAPWELGDPTNGEGFEGAFAYALAAKLGFAEADVVWTVVPFDNSFAPGAKAFDLDINQVSAKPERAAAVDLSDGLLHVEPVGRRPRGERPRLGEDDRGVEDLQVRRPGRNDQPRHDHQRHRPERAADGLHDERRCDRRAQGQADRRPRRRPTDRVLRHRRPGGDSRRSSVSSNRRPVPTPEHFSVVLAKASPLTACVNAAIAAMKSDGSLDAITKEWLADKAEAPVFTP